MPRRPHTKSRTGCQRCKEKHVKCDEARPVCGTCARYNVPCVAKAPPPKVAQSQLSRTASPPALSVSPRPHLGTSQSRSALTLSEFGLLHHWIVEVADSFQISPGFHNAWRGRFVTAALHHEFFLHMMLMLSALHLSLTRSPAFHETHRAFILEGCSGATAGFRKEAENIHASNCHVVQSFPFLLSIYALALPQFDREAEGDRATLDEIIHILSLIQSNSFTRNTTNPWMHLRELEPWVELEDFSGGSDEAQWDLTLARALDNLQPWIDASDDAPASQQVNSRAVKAFIESISAYHLKKNLRPMSFPAVVKPEYFDLLRHRNPMALVILAHYAVVLWYCREQWWCSNWGWRVVSVVASMLPKRYVVALAYPFQVLNLEEPA